MTQNKLSIGEKWSEHYRGFRLHVNQKEDVWWQVYNGTDRLKCEDFPKEIVEDLLEVRPLGGRIHITETGQVLTKLEEEESDTEEYTGVWIGEVDLSGKLVPDADKSKAIEIQPTGLSAGDLWPSVYDGARYSYNVNGRLWWRNTQTRKNHSVTSTLPDNIWRQLRVYKPEGGSFRVTPNGDVITLIRDPAPQLVREQFGSLPPVVRNIIKLRKERADLSMLPVYIGTLENPSFSVEEPPSLTRDLSPEEEQALEDWAASLGSTDKTSPENHKATPDSATEATDSQTEEEEPAPEFDDDPIEWLQEDLKKTEERITGGDN
ncbi:hypothetical protein [Haladaptatus sp. ZSTT2]|uniref:hypothetical protein n=1 Tax=Haladaptatus sp. ZSTT2 TaxID=3120515 RepID=UPI00300EFD59